MQNMTDEEVRCVEKISDVMRCSRLRWIGHVLRKEGNDWVKKSMEMTVEGNSGKMASKCLLLLL